MRTDTVYAEPYTKEVRAAIYCRLSKDDDLKGPSASIQNQRELLCRYCEEQGWRVSGIFQDDGYTGLNMDRPDFQKMLSGIERGMFDVVLTKDLSRLGRNYLQVGQLLEDFSRGSGCGILRSTMLLTAISKMKLRRSARC